MFDFPTTPPIGTAVTMPDGSVRYWDGQKWDASASGSATPPPLHGLLTANVVDYGADASGVADSAPAFVAALATGSNVYAPTGTYRLDSMITVGATSAQTLFGDGLSTILQIDQAFDANTTTSPGVINLYGVEAGASLTTVATVRDLWMRFVQPSDVTSRSTFKTLATGGTSGTGGTGVMYPPALWFNNGVNRWHLYRLRISNCWDGIIQGPVGSSGGWWIEQIEISPYSRGLSVRENLDLSHIKGWHHWAFDMVGSQHSIQEDGQCYAMKLGEGGTDAQGIICFDVSATGARFLIDGGDTDVSFNNLVLDSGSVLENHFSTSTVVSNVSVSPGPAQIGDASIKMTNGLLQITNVYGFNQPGTAIIAQTGGSLNISNGELITSNVDRQMISQSGGALAVRGVTFIPSGLSPWTLAPVHVSGGNINFVANSIHSYNPAPAPIGFLQIDVDSPANVVDGMSWPRHYFTPPGSQGNYGLRTSPQTYNFGIQPVIFAEYGDQITFTTAASAPGTSAITVASVAGVIAGGPNANIVTDTTTPGAIPLGTTAVSMGGNIVILSNPLTAPGVANGDVIHFTLATGIASTTVATVSSTGALHLGSGAGATVNDSALFVNGGGYSDNSTLSYLAPASGSTVTLSDNVLTHILEPGATLASLTVSMPLNAQRNNNYVRIATTQTITALTLQVQSTSGHSINAPPTTLAANSSVLYLFTGSTWFRMQ